MPRTKSTPDTGEGSGRVTKTAAVKEALATLGPDAMPSEIQAYVAQKHSIDMSLNHISNIKSSMKTGGSGGSGGGGKKNGRRRRRRKQKRGAAVAIEAAVVVAKNGPGRPAAGIRIEDIEATKQLVRKVGLANLHTLIDIVAK